MTKEGHASALELTGHAAAPLPHTAPLPPPAPAVYSASGLQGRNPRLVTILVRPGFCTSKPCTGSLTTHSVQLVHGSLGHFLSHSSKHISPPLHDPTLLLPFRAHLPPLPEVKVRPSGTLPFTSHSPPCNRSFISFCINNYLSSIYR